MRSIYCARVLLGVSMTWIGGCALHGAERQTKPVLDGQVATNIAIKLAGEAVHSQNYSGQIMQFEPSTREWTMPIDALAVPDSAKHFVARVNESTGLACLELPPATGCVVQEDIHQLLADAKAKADARTMAREHPAPDLQQMAEVLLQYQLRSDRSYGADPSRTHLFVSIPSPDAKGVVDLSPDVVARFKRDGIDISPGKAWKPSKGNVSPNRHFDIGLPVRRPDGNYDVPYSYYCGPLCAAWYTAVMRRDESGWHVVSTVLTAIS